MAALDTLLAGLAKERSTGALRVGRAGTVFLDEGRVTYMECAQTPGVERILSARGRMPEAALRRLQTDGGTERLLAEGPVTLGELQFCVLGAVLDAAFFLLPSAGTRPKFRPGERHWLGGCWYFDVRGLVRECARRRAHLALIWPSADVDTAPVRPVPRLAGHGVALSRVQWEVVTHADHELTPLELARRLGRSGYSVLQAVRELAAAGLLAPAPSGEERPALPKRSRQAARTKSGPEGGTRARPYQESQPGPAPGPEHGPGSAARADPGPGVRLVGPAVTADPADLELLMRLKKALEELA
ncbi:hypothetical protein [Nonomuraea indica]|uniref:hypothetical protein n=1 Tax=Nonomuraea indica TaxID=1581193 RepID=UPI000C7E0045|nr:hypothetical protein [Nonomuraea indica]